MLLALKKLFSNGEMEQREEEVLFLLHQGPSKAAALVRELFAKASLTSATTTSKSTIGDAKLPESLKAMENWLREKIGNASRGSWGDSSWQRWEEWRQELEALNQSEKLQQDSRHGMPRLRALALRHLPPAWAQRVTHEGLSSSNELSTPPHGHSGAATASVDEVLPADWALQWALKSAQAYLLSIDISPKLNELIARRTDVDVESRKVAERTLASALPAGARARMTQRRVAALRQLSDALRVLHQSGTTSQRAVRARHELREALPSCFEVLPMVLTTIDVAASQLPSVAGLFDLVILDEGSQSEPRAVSALLRGARVLLVGDERQVSPLDSVKGMRSSEQHMDLAQQLFSGLPCSAQVLPGKSIFDAARSTFVGGGCQHTLREHFRCVPALIGWCNERYYHGLLQPLRVPRAHEAMDPPLLDIYVKGSKENRQNMVEAKTVVAEVKKLLQDGVQRTIGVIAMTGEQADLIEKELRKQVDTAAWLRHNIRVGSPRSFQGDERDVIVMSLVEDEKSARYSHVKVEDHQRYNVAMSRARNRLVLVRSCRPEDIRANRQADGKGELKLSIIEHFAEAKERQKQLMLQPPGRESSSVHHGEAAAPGPGAKALIEGLRTLGFQATPGVWVRPGARLDVIVEDAKASLRAAILVDNDASCDGFNTVEVQESLEMQLAMQRVGWTFCRLSASRCLLATDQCLQQLHHWLTETCKIQPCLTLAGPTSGVKRQRPSEGSQRRGSVDQHQGASGAFPSRTSSAVPNGTKVEGVPQGEEEDDDVDCAGDFGAKFLGEVQDDEDEVREAPKKMRRIGGAPFQALRGTPSTAASTPVAAATAATARRNGSTSSAAVASRSLSATTSHKHGQPVVAGRLATSSSSSASGVSPANFHSRSANNLSKALGPRRGQKAAVIVDDDDDEEDGAPLVSVPLGTAAAAAAAVPPPRSIATASPSGSQSSAGRRNVASSASSASAQALQTWSFECDEVDDSEVAKLVQRALEGLSSSSSGLSLPSTVVAKEPPEEDAQLQWQKRLEAREEVERILSVRAGGVVLPGADAGAKRRSFKRIALLLHPDKGLCEDARAAQDALRRAWEAYRALDPRSS